VSGLADFCPSVYHDEIATGTKTWGERQMTDTTGGCLCGRVRYTASREPAFSGLCHCRNCQRFTGSAFETTIGFPTSAVSVQGDLKTYSEVSDTGQAVRRRFCPHCGSGILAEADAFPGMTIFLAGTLDDPSSYHPTMELYCSSAQPWVSAGGERAKYAKMPS
jgi:hypothetical protein